ncbi:hypothetical protein B0H10DRAFT_1958853 [Mycena sp. CBHHK59/15]|nr:hypothetical protein B0H10DRAFT_1958853 [Mycena sp. CBHHK59/15]
MNLTVREARNQPESGDGFNQGNAGESPQYQYGGGMGQPLENCAHGCGSPVYVTDSVRHRIHGMDKTRPAHTFQRKHIPDERRHIRSSPAHSPTYVSCFNSKPAHSEAVLASWLALLSIQILRLGMDAARNSTNKLANGEVKTNAVSAPHLCHA